MSEEMDAIRNTDLYRFWNGIFNLDSYNAKSLFALFDSMRQKSIMICEIIKNEIDK